MQSTHLPFTRRLTILLLVICASAQLFATLPSPMVGWHAPLPSNMALGDTITEQVDTFSGNGTNSQLNWLQFVPSLINADTASKCHVTWTSGREANGAVQLCSTGAIPTAGGVLQCGSGGTTSTLGSQFTFHLRFKINKMPYRGGSSPQYELDGYLLNTAIPSPNNYPNLLLYMSGRGSSGKAKHYPHLRITDVFTGGTTEYYSDYYPTAGTPELLADQWYDLVVTWDGTKAADNDYVSHETSTLRTRMWINGTEYTVKRMGHANASPTTCRIGDPLYVGGNRRWNNLPIALDAFDIFSGILTDTQVGECNAAESSASGPALTLAPAYETKTTLNQATNWQAPPADVTITTAGSNQAVKVCIGNLIAGDQRKLYFTQPIPLDRRVTSVNLWAYLGYEPQGDCGFALAPIYTTGTGTEVIGSFPVEFLKSHIAMPCVRASALWQFCMADPLFSSGVTQLVGVSITMTYTAGVRTPAQSTSLYLRDIGLERIKYASSSVYYVVGNYRDNFSGVGRPLTEQSGGSATPYLLLDNLVDQAKSGRPATLNLYVSAFDTNDNLVYSTECTNVPSVTAIDASYQVSMPITQPGTYRVRCQSYNASTGVYFTTDWTKYIVIKGATQTLTPLSSFGLLAVNPTKPFGRLETTDPQTISFTVNNLAMKTLTFPLTIKYKVIPYDEWIPGTAAKRTLTLDQTLTVNGLGTLTATYTPLHPVELVVAELWQGTTVLDHEERTIGIRNELSVAPPFTAQSQVKSLDDIAGPGKNWHNISFHSNPGDNIYQQIANNIAEAKKLTPLLGMNMRFNRIQPIPGVYDWDYLTPMFDLAQTNGCTLLPYLNLKWPADWAPVEFQIDANGCVHRGAHVWGYMNIGNYLYSNGATAPGYNQQFVQQLARKYLNHLGLAGFYFENEHIDTQGYDPITLSYHEAYRQAFGTWLQGQYGTIAALNTKYGTTYTAFADVQLPVLDGANYQKKAMFVDFRLFQRNQVEQYVS
ncbi:MAG TPA: beta-galactosidase, partial [Armatimonadota bacterium]